MSLYDLLIVGDGPAGLSCALTARQRNLSTLVVGSGAQSGWLYQTEQIDNYPGLPGVSGKTLLQIFHDQAEAAGVTFHTGVVRQVMPMSDTFMVLIGNDILSARSVVLAMGAARPKLLPGEEALLGQGVSWCGTCDGMFYRGKDVAVLSAWQGGVEEGIFLSSLATKVDYYFLKAHEVPTDASFSCKHGKPLSLRREDGKIILTTDGGEASYDGVFLFRPAVAPSQMVTGLDTAKGFIAVDAHQRTNIPRLYAAGDCAGQPLQVAKAAGEGNVAAISAAEDLSRT